MSVKRIALAAAVGAAFVMPSFVPAQASGTGETDPPPTGPVAPKDPPKVDTDNSGNRIKVTGLLPGSTTIQYTTQYPECHWTNGEAHPLSAVEVEALRKAAKLDPYQLQQEKADHGLGRWYPLTCPAWSQIAYLKYDYAPSSLFSTPDVAVLLQKLLVAPTPVLSPPAPKVIVRLPMWLAVKAWAPVVLDLAPYGLDLRVRATPTKTVWTMGDGSKPLECVGESPAFNPSVDDPAHPPAAACTYTYTKSSASAPNHVFKGQAVVVYEDITYSNDGGATWRPLTVTRTPQSEAATFDVRVNEIQSILTGGLA